MFHKPVVRQMVELLPPEDGALDELLAEVVAAHDLKAFMYVVTAAAVAERRMDARHLTRGAMMFPDHRWLGKVAVRMHGDVAEHLLGWRLVGFVGLQRWSYHPASAEGAERSQFERGLSLRQVANEPFGLRGV